MQYNLDFIKEGASFPPEEEAFRINGYVRNKQIYKGNIEQVFADYIPRIQSDDITATAFITHLNYCRLQTIKTADLVSGELPEVKSEDADEKKLEEAKAIVDAQLRTASIDYSRYGEFVSRFARDENGKPEIIVFSPSIWIPVVSEENNIKVNYHIIAYPSTEGKIDVLKVQIHEKGKYTQRVFRVQEKARAFTTQDNQKVGYTQYVLGREIKEPEEFFTDTDDFVIFHGSNERTSDDIHGHSDYNDTASIMAEMEIRFAQIAKILDKHAEPNLTAGEDALEWEDDKIVGVRTGGKVWIMGKDGEKPEYMTWEGELNAAFRHIEELRKEFLTMSEMGAVLGDFDTSGAEGFEALQIKMVNARLKARRITEQLDPIYKKQLKMVYKALTNKDLTDLSVYWNDGLPNDEKRDTEIATMKINARLISRQTARQQYEGMTESSAIEEGELIDAETPATFETNLFA